MGGGSADGAAVLRGLNTLFEVGLDANTLRKLAESVGSDVPFCIEGGTSLARGRGEILTQLSPLPQCSIVVCKPSISISTPQLFSKIKCNKIKLRPDTKGIISALECENIVEVSKRMFNVFEAVIPNNAGEIFEIKEALLDHRALGAVMTGTGSAVFGVFDVQENAEAAYEFLSHRYDECYLTKPAQKLNV
jgi:4-diphosphocytidyl-2-C-methyl-D-erythritol kinase